jgi:ribokinase
MVYVFNNLIVDFLLYIEGFPVEARALEEVSHVAIGPGGACNVAIVAARMGLSVSVLGEVGQDYFGEILLGGLQREGILTSEVLVNKEGATPVAGVLVDPEGEPGYLGYAGAARLDSLPDEWRASLRGAEALFVDGWIEYPAVAGMALEALEMARGAGAQTFFDPGPGNPRQDNTWHLDAAARATVLLATEAEIARLTSEGDMAVAAAQLLANGSELVIVKRGADGLVLYTSDEMLDLPGLPLKARDATGAGDSLSGAVMYGRLHNFSLPALGNLANATGTAKVLKIGTGHQVPTTAEIRAILDEFKLQVPGWH